MLVRSLALGAMIGGVAATAWGGVAVSVLDYVDPFVGTEYSGNTFPGPTRPFGLVQPSPDSGHGSGRYAAGYKRLEETIYGFSQTHLSGMGCGDLGDVLLLPYTGEGPVGTNLFYGAKDRFCETAKVGYYSVALTNFGVTAEVAASHRVGFHRWTYPKGATPKALVDLQWACYDPGPAPQLRGEGDPQVRYVLDYAGALGADKRTITGHRVTDGWMRGRTVAWHLQFSRPWKKATWEADPKGGKAGRYLLEFEEDQTPLECRVAISSCDEAGAKRNFDAEAGVAFDTAVSETRAAWEKLLSRAKFSSTDTNKLRILYTGLYHADVQPIDMSDVDGRYRGGDLRIARSTAPDGSFYSNFSTWDTFRSVQAMYALLVPERVDGMVNSMLAHYKAVGCLPIHVDFGIENHCMVAVHSVPLITESYLKGFRGFDAELALEAVTNSLSVAHAGYPREDWDLLEKYGYIPFDKVFNQSASRTLEVAYDDACVAKMAKAMGNDAVARRFDDRSWAWTNLFDRSVGFIRGKDSKGNWRHPFDPAKTGWVSHPQFDFTEGSSWTYTWHVMQHPEALIAALGKERAGEMLDTFFREPGRYDHGNEPGHHILYLYPYAGKPWAAERKLREISSTYHFATSDGITGNDDCGQVSCWYMFTALGFYPVDPSSCTYVIGAPQIDRAELQLAGGKVFTMVAHGLSERAKYVKAVKLNGRPLDGFLLKHADILAGGTLEFEMSETPSGGTPGVRNEQADMDSLWTARVQPEPDNFLPCFHDWKNKPVTRERWEEIVRKWTHDAWEGALYGVRPVGRPADLVFETIDEREDIVRGAIRRTVRITYGGPGGRDSFEATAFIPKSAKPVGSFLLICNRDPKVNLDLTRMNRTEFWPVEEIVRRGYAAIAFWNQQLCPDDPKYTFDKGVHRVYSPEGRSSRSWGAISAWAWGASRVLDWIETQKELDATKVAVVGHSRGGKTSFWAGADDPRFAMTCVNDSGCLGAKMNRMRVPDAETSALISACQPHWFTIGWRRYDGREEQFGLDTHDIAALIAPRLLAIASADADCHAGPVAEFATAKFGSHAWEMYGLEGLGKFAFPARPDTVLRNGCVQYQYRKGKHDLTLWDWKNYMDFADAHDWPKAEGSAAHTKKTWTPAARTGVAIQAAIDDCTAAGGGVVALEAGQTYESGTIYLKSNVELHIPEGAVLKGYGDWSKYDDVDDPRIQKVPEFSKKAFIACIFQDNVAITGKGVIDGNGLLFYHEQQGAFFKKPPHPRTRMIEFVGCRNVRFEDVTFKDSPGWTCWIRMCEDFSAFGVRIDGDQRMINNDGFHFDGCRRMRLIGCNVKSGDDSVVMRSIISPNGDSGLCEDLLVEDCTLDSACQAVRLGCPSDGVIRHAVFRNCRMSGRNGISSQHPVRYLQDGDSGNLTMEDILFENCRLDCRQSALCFWVQEGILLKSFGNVTFRNVEIKSLGPLMLKGCEGTPLKNIRFENVRASVEAKEPLEMQHVEGLVLENCTFSSWPGEHWFDALNKTQTWERVR